MVQLTTGEWIALGGMLLTLLTVYVMFKRNTVADSSKAAADTTAMMVKLEYIGTGVTEIKTEMRSVKDDVRSLEKRVTIAEQSTKQAHKRLDEHVRLTMGAESED